MNHGAMVRWCQAKGKWVNSPYLLNPVDAPFPRDPLRMQRDYVEGDQDSIFEADILRRGITKEDIVFLPADRNAPRLR
jgi:hypothetical protein